MCSDLPQVPLVYIFSGCAVAAIFDGYMRTVAGTADLQRLVLERAPQLGSGAILDQVSVAFHRSGIIASSIDGNGVDAGDTFNAGGLGPHV